MRARGSVDVGRLSAAAQRPGIDPRVWITLGIVKEVGFDAAEGIFADVQLQPSGEIETCFLGAPYAGAEFGMFAPVQVDDTVLVAVPSGDPNHGPVIIARMWDAADKPASDFAGSGDDPTEDVVLRVRAGKKLRVRVKGSGGQVDIQAEEGANINIQSGGSGKIVIHASGSEKVYLGGETGTQPVALGTVIKTHLLAIKGWLDAHTHVTTATVSTGPVGVNSPPAVASPEVPDVEADEAEVK